MGAGVNGVFPESFRSLGESQSRYRFPEGFFVASVVALAGVLRRGDLGVEALRVLGWLLEHVRRDNRIEVTQAYIAGELGIKPPNVARAFRALQEQRLLLRVREPHGVSHWYLDSRALYRGSAKSHEASLARQRRQRERDRRSNVVALSPPA